MRIAMIGQKGIPATYGGVERHVEDLAVNLVQAGHRITVYGRFWYTRVKKNKFQGVDIKLLPSVRTKHLDTITHVFFSTIHALFQNYDVIHYHGVGPALLSWIPRLFTPKIKIIITFHSIDRYHQKWNWLAKIFLRLGEWFACRLPRSTIVVSEALQKYCLNEYHHETVYIPNGAGRKKPELTPQEKLTDFNLEPENYLLMVSRLIPHKGAHLLIEAFLKLKENPDADEKIKKLKLAIVGGSVHTDKYVTDLHALAGKNSDIVFTGFQAGNALRRLYQNASVLVHPSLNEGLPITVLEAMSYGKPTLLSDIPEHQELIRNPEVLFKSNNVRDLENKIREFIGLDAAEQKTLGRKNKAIVERHYSWESITPRIIAVYEEDNRGVRVRTSKANI
ncbi:MAG: glycosyltransferase family 4 protein [Patescibacteria group bacterium]